MNSLTDYLDIKSSSGSSSPNVDAELMMYNQQGLNYELSRYSYDFAGDLAMSELGGENVYTQGQSSQGQQGQHGHIQQAQSLQQGQGPSNLGRQSLPNLVNVSPGTGLQPAQQGPLQEVPPGQGGHGGTTVPSLQPGFSPNFQSTIPDIQSRSFLPGHHRQDSQLPLFDSPRKRRRDSSAVVEDNELKRIAYDMLNTMESSFLHNVEIMSLSAVETKDTVSSLASKLEHSGQSGGSETLRHLESFAVLSKESKRQILAIIWLIQNCRLSPTSVVPRNRVYSKFVNHYSNFNIFPLTAANLGKLVRVLFPNLNVRRLGVRGQSKYHYCGIKLIDDKYDMPEHFRDPTPFDMNQMLDDLHIIRYRYKPDLFNTIRKDLNSIDFDMPVEVPSIYPFLPQDVDLDIADTLYSLYKINNSTLVEGLRYMDVELVINTFGNFMSILTSPVFKLFIHKQLIEWVYMCDLWMYKLMLKMVFGTLTHFITSFESKDLLSQFKIISSQFRSKLFNSINNKLPEQLVAVKIACSDFFTSYLDKFIGFVELTHQLKGIGDNINVAQVKNAYRQIDFASLLNKLPFGSATVSSLNSVFEGDVIEIINDFSIQKLRPVMDKVFGTSIPVRTMKVYLQLIITEIFKELVTDTTQEMILAKFWIQDYLDLYLEATGVINFTNGSQSFNNKTLKRGLDLLNLNPGESEAGKSERANSFESDQHILPKTDTEYVIGRSKGAEDSGKYPQSPEDSFDTFEKSFGEFIHIKQELILD